jgi:hypothetical protein
VLFITKLVDFGSHYTFNITEIILSFASFVPLILFAYIYFDLFCGEWKGIKNIETLYVGLVAIFGYMAILIFYVGYYNVFFNPYDSSLNNLNHKRFFNWFWNKAEQDVSIGILCFIISGSIIIIASEISFSL